MIDLHAHILPGIDDGPVGMEESAVLARAAVADGTTVMAATPHVRDDFPTSPERMLALVDQVRAALRDRAIPLDLRTGGEVAWDRVDSLHIDDLRAFSLGGSGRYLLVESPSYGWPFSLARSVGRLGREGLIVVLAHPERNGDVQRDPERLRPLVEAGCLVQLTADSLLAPRGRPVLKAARSLLELGLAHLIGSDAHGAAVRRGSLSQAAESLDDPGLAHWLTHDVGEAILAGAPVPAAPPRSKRRRWLGRDRD